ncbi:hypothetical protein BYT27DRAFT_7188484 [Phlegmacium glaucopus]|nr:hypothetical protein BYT27DRAFT_7188484 [Phlegmacium glaucopus]
MPAADVNILYAQVRRRMIESGEWDQIRAVLSAKLNESGWSDEAHHRSKEAARTMEPLLFSTLFSEISPRIQTSMPLAVKREVSNLIRQHVERQFE